jgi:hypothetical protein
MRQEIRILKRELSSLKQTVDDLQQFVHEKPSNTQAKSATISALYKTYVNWGRMDLMDTKVR